MVTCLPHAVLNGQVAVEDVFRELKPLFIRQENLILKTKEAYLEKNKKDILISALTVEAGKNVTFLVLVSGRPDGVVVRLYPDATLEKTVGVKRVLAELTKQLMQSFPAFKLGETNLTEYLK
jgi:hypothetical protein